MKRPPTAYDDLFEQVMEHDTDNMRAVAALLLNSYNPNIPNTGFPADRFRHLDAQNRAAVLSYLDWLGGAGGRYPPDDDMERLKVRWVELGWDQSGD